MALLPIIVAPDPRLKKVSAPVEAVGPELRRLMDDMLETMYEAPGIGLAAPQVGTLQRVIVIDVSKDKSAPLRLVNPEILWLSDELAEYEEGCLSLPDHYAEVSRPDAVRVAYLDENGERQELDAEGILATCIQHEMDHLDGLLFVDHISLLKRNMILRKLAKAKRSGRIGRSESPTPAL